MLEAARAGINAFHRPDPADQLAMRAARGSTAQNAEVTVAYRKTGTVDRQLAQRPHATLQHYLGTINVGDGHLMDAAFLTYAAVRPTDRRKGLLRELVRRNLLSIDDKGIPLALLTASEGGIYSRFGFQPVYQTSSTQLDVSRGFELSSSAARLVKESGRIEEVTLQWLLPQIPQLAADFHQHYRMSITRQAGFSEELYQHPNEEVVDSTYRAAVHLDVKGRVDGFVTFKVSEENRRQVASVRELITSSPGAELALWMYLAHLDLVERVVAREQPTDPILELAAANPRDVQILRPTDFLWARILDPQAALMERAYTVAALEAGMGIRFEVVDQLEFASGTFEIQLDEAGPTVSRIDSPSQLKISVQALAALILGGDSATRLAAAGLISGATMDVANYLDALFAPVGLARCAGDF